MSLTEPTQLTSWNLWNAHFAGQNCINHQMPVHFRASGTIACRPEQRIKRAAVRLKNNNRCVKQNSHNKTEMLDNFNTEIIVVFGNHAAWMKNREKHAWRTHAANVDNKTAFTCSGKCGTAVKVSKCQENSSKCVCSKYPVSTDYNNRNRRFSNFKSIKHCIHARRITNSKNCCSKYFSRAGAEMLV